MFGYIAMFLKGECGVISCVFVLFDFNFKYEIKKRDKFRIQSKDYTCN